MTRRFARVSLLCADATKAPTYMRELAWTRCMSIFATHCQEDIFHDSAYVLIGEASSTYDPERQPPYNHPLMQLGPTRDRETT